MVSLLQRVDRHTALVGAAGALLPLFVIVGLPQPVQALLAVALLAVVPGYALTRLMPVREGLLIAVGSIAVSLAVATVVSTTLLYLGLWSWQASVVVLGLVTVGACAMRLRTVPQ